MRVKKRRFFSGKLRGRNQREKKGFFWEIIVCVKKTIFWENYVRAIKEKKKIFFEKLGTCAIYE